MKELIHIDDTHDHTLREFIDKGIEVLTELKDCIPQEDLIYPGREVFFTINNFIKYLNTLLNGEVTMKQVQSRHYSFTYYSKPFASRKASINLHISMAKSAIDIENLTGKLPMYLNNPKYSHVKEIVDDLKMGRRLPMIEKPQKFVDPEDSEVAHE